MQTFAIFDVLNDYSTKYRDNAVVDSHIDLVNYMMDEIGCHVVKKYNSIEYRGYDQHGDWYITAELVRVY